MKRKINLLVIAFIGVSLISVVLAVILNNGVIGLVSLLLVMAIGALYLLLNIKQEPEVKNITVSPKDEKLIEIKLLDSLERVDGIEKEVKEQYPLIHVDELEDDKVIIRVFKDKVSVPDSSVRINK